MADTQMFIEQLFPDIKQSLTIDETIYDGKSAFQQIRIIRNNTLGRVLILDNIVQTTEKDEFVYHEMLTHLPLFMHPQPKNILVIGAGDGGIIEELFKHPGIEHVVMVEIDGEVITLSQQYLHTICKTAFQDPRLELVIDDGAKYLEETTRKFDLVIVDSSDPIGPSTTLFSERFYRNIHSVLTEQGIMVRQTGSSFYQEDELSQNYAMLKKIFPHVQGYVAAIPTYIGGFFTCVLACKSAAIEAVTPAHIQQRFEQSGIETQYYSPQIHAASFALPPYIKKRLL